MKLLLSAALLLYGSVAFADELALDDLLSDIAMKSDLSEKTKIASAGVSFIYTRNDLERMQVKRLKDILKFTYPYNYAENRYGLPDPATNGTTHPFVSSGIRVYIDNQEISTGIYGSGLIVMGDIDLGFVDHIEVYTQNPSFEFSSEPVTVLVKLYSKTAERDAGTKVALSTGSHGGGMLSGYDSEELDEWSYFTYLSHADIKREKYYSHETELSRDRQVTHVFGSFYNDTQRILIEGLKQSRDTFIDFSLDATPEEATLDMNALHIGYDGRVDNFSFLASYEYMLIDSNFKDSTSVPYTSIKNKNRSHVYHLELKYDVLTTDNKLLLGAGSKYKTLKHGFLILNGADYPASGHTYQLISNIYFENQYAIEENSLLNIGVKYSKVTNNHSVQDDDLFLFRAGHTYTTENFTFKTVATHTEVAMDPYLVNSYGTYITAGKKEKTTQNIFTENIIYENGDNRYELVIGAGSLEDVLTPNAQGLLDNSDETIYANSLLGRWTHHYNDYDKFFLLMNFNNYTDLPQINSLNVYNVVARNINTYKKFDIFNELVYYRDDMDHKSYYDYSLGIKYHHTKDLTLSLKGENIFDKAKTTVYHRVDPVTFTPEAPLEIAPIDQNFIASIEYLF